MSDDQKKMVLISLEELKKIEKISGITYEMGVFQVDLKPLHQLRPINLYTLIELAGLGACSNIIISSTTELSTVLDSSQQAISRNLSLLKEKKFISYETYTGTKSEIRITDNGINVLKYLLKLLSDQLAVPYEKEKNNI